jgi:hypothetical protein
MNHLQAVSQEAQLLESSSVLSLVYFCSYFSCSACIDAEGTGTSSDYPTTQAHLPQTKCRKRTEIPSAYYQHPFHETSLTVMVIPAIPLHQRPNWPTLVAMNSPKYLVMLSRQWSHSCLKAHRCHHHLRMNKPKTQGEDPNWPCQCHPSPHSGYRTVSQKDQQLLSVQPGRRQPQGEVPMTFRASISQEMTPRQHTDE